MHRTVTAHLEIDLAGRTDMIYSLSAALGAGIRSEDFSFVLDGEAVGWSELVDHHGTRLHRLEGGPGTLVVDYRAEVEGRSGLLAVEPLDSIRYLRPSRYCDSDRLLPTARSEFRGLSGHELLAAVTGWVSAKIRYARGSSVVTDGATQTLLSRRGVCRDYAHLVIALLRALDVPARMVAVYAPGLAPMDFHAVAEALIDGEWFVVDATRLAPRQSMLRIATGRDAADVSFLTNHWAHLTLRTLQVSAVVDDLPDDDGVQLVQLG